MNQENKHPSNNLSYTKFLSKTFRKKLEDNDEEQSSITPKRPLLSRDRAMGTHIDVSPLSDNNSRFEKSKYKLSPTIKNDQSSISVFESCTFIVNHSQSSRSTIIDDNDNTYIPIKARPAPSTTWKPSIPITKSSTTLKASIESLQPIPELLPTPPIKSFQPAIRARIPFNLSSTNTIDKQTHAYTIWLNALFTPVDFICHTPINQTYKSSAELNRWYILRDYAQEVFTYDIQPIATKISADIDIDNCRINPKSDLNFSPRTINRQALLNFISSYNKIWFRLAMEIIFPINIENYQQMKLAIDQYLIQSPDQISSNENNLKKINFNLNNKTASVQARLTIKNLILIIIFLERAKLLRLIDNDPCLYNRDSKFKSTKESLDVLSRDFISTDTNLLRRLKLAGYEPIYKQTSLDEFNYLINNNLFEDLKDGIRLTRCAQILLSSTNQYVARFDLSTKLKCPVVNRVHKLLNIDQAFELFHTYGHVNLTAISNKDIMNGNKQRTLELLWRIFITCHLPKRLSPIEKLTTEISILTQNLSKFTSCSIEQQLITSDIIPLQKQDIDFTPIIHLLIKWVQLICAHYKFWLYDLQESFADGRAFLYIISYYLPSLCDYKNDIKHLTTLATCQTRDEHIQFNHELGQPHLINIYERNVKSNFRLLEECIKQFGTFSSELIKYESYAKDVPDERHTIIILAMLAHDLLILNTNNENDFRHQLIFEELKDKYSNEIKIEEIKIIRDQVIHPIPIINLSQSVLDTMNYDILDRLELLSELDDNEHSFNSVRSKIDHRRTSISTTMATISLDDFIELEKNIENEENKNNNTSLFLIDETISSEIDTNESNKLDETCFADPVNTKMIKEIFTLFLSNQQRTLENEESIDCNNQSKSEIERQTHAAEIIQAHWRGYQVRIANHNHPVVGILERLRSNKSSLTIRERLMQIVQEFSEASVLSLSGYIHFLNDLEPIINCCYEIRYLIVQQGLLRLFFILMRCSNRSGPSTVLINQILNILQLFTVKHDLIMKLIDKTEQIKDFVMILLKYYEKNNCEIFEKICFLLQTIVKDEKARKILQSNKSFTNAVQYISKRMFNKISNENDKQVRSTPKQPLTERRTTVLNQSSILYPTPKMTRRSINILKRNLNSFQQFIKIFYHD